MKKKQKKQTLGEEQLAQALKDAGAIDHDVWSVIGTLDANVYRPHPAPPLNAPEEPKTTIHVNGSNGASNLDVGEIVIGVPDLDAKNATLHGMHTSVRRIFVQAERWVDARAFGRLMLGLPEVQMQKLSIDDHESAYPRWQLRETTYGAKRMRARRVYGRHEIAENFAEEWRDVHDL